MANSILLTGVTGYLGKNLLESILKRFVGDKVIALTRDPVNLLQIHPNNDSIKFIEFSSSNLRNIFKENQVKIVIHCATCYGSKLGFDPNLIESNVLFPTQILNLAIEENVPYFINIDTALNKKTSNYALSKYLFREILFKSAKNICAVNIRLEYFYGPSEPDSRFLKGLIKNLLSCEDEISITSGEQIRDFIFIDDAISAVDTILKNLEYLPSGPHNFFVAGGNPQPIKELVVLASSLIKNCKTSFNFGSIEESHLNQIDSCLSLGPIKKLGWKPKVNLRAGILQIIKHEMRTSK